MICYYMLICLSPIAWKNYLWIGGRKVTAQFQWYGLQTGVMETLNLIGWATNHKIKANPVFTLTRQSILAGMMVNVTPSAPFCVKLFSKSSG